MIFKTFDSKIDNWTSKIGIFGKSFNELGTAANNAFKSVINNIDNFDDNVGLWESLKNNLFGNKKNNKDWIKNSLGAIISKDNIDSYIAELDLDSAKEKLQGIFDWQKDVKNNNQTWQELFTTLDDGEGYIVDLIKNTDDLSKLTGEDLVKANQQARASTLAHNEAIKAQTFSAKAGSVALKALSVAGNMLAMWAISEAISGLYKLSQVSKDVAKSAKELGESFSSAKSDIDDYKSKISNLYDTINDSNSSIEDVTNARKSLLSIQDELIDKFGTEKSVINDVTDAINGQTEALDRLTNSKWQETKNTFNDGGFWNDVANWSQGYEDNIDRMIDGMENAREILSFSYNDFTGKNGDFSEIKRQIEQLGWVYKDTLGGYVKEGNLEGIYSDILKIQDLVENFDAPDMLIKDLTKDANSIKSTLDGYKDIWSTYVLQDRIFTDEDLADSFKNINDAYAEYQKVFASGDEDSIAKAQDKFANILTKATEGLDDQSVIDYFNNMYPTLQSVVSGWKFNIAFEANTDNLQSNVQSVLEKLKDESGRSLTTEEILGLNADNEQYQSLISIAHSYNMTLEEMIELLKERNLVSAMDYQGLVGLFGQEDVDKLSTEDLEIAYTIKNVGSITFDDLQAEIQKIKDSAIETEISITFEEAWADSFTSEDDDIKELGNTLLGLAEKGRLTKEIFEEADSTVGDYFKNLGISADEAVAKINRLVDESEQLSSMSSQISSMATALGTKQEDGFVSADTLSGFDVEVRGLESWDRFQEVLGSTISSYEECQEAANTLATEWVNSSDFLAQLTEQNREYYATQLEAMGIENYEEVITYAQALNEAKETLAQSSLMLGEATQDEIEALIAEGQYSELTANMILALYDAKVAEQAATLDTAADCANLIALAGDTDRTSKSIELLIQLMNIYKNLESGVYDNNEFARTGALAVATGIKAQLEAIANGETENLVIEPTVKLGSKGKSSAKSAGKEAGKSLKDGLKEELSDLEGIISSLSKTIDDQKEVITSQKEVALEAIESQISALEAERDARLEAIEAEKKALENQIKAIDKQIKAKQKEIDAINDAAKARQHEIDLQKAQYELERMQNQRVILQYSEDKGMHYVADESGIRDAREKVDDAKRQLAIDAIEKEIDLLEESKDLLNEQIDLLDEQAESIKNFYDAQIKSLEKQKESTEKYFESLMKSIEGSKDKYQELLDIVDKAELSGKLKKLGIDEEALLNGSEEEFEKLKNAYLDVVFQVNEGNEEMLSSLRELSGYEGTAPTVLTETAEKLDEVNEQLDTSTESMGKLSDSAATASEGTSAIATSMEELSTNTEGVSDNLTSINDALTGLPEAEKITAISDAFTNMGEAIKSVADALGVGEEGTVGGLVGALQSLSEISLGEMGGDGQGGGTGIVSQFQALKSAVDDVTNAISGGGSSGGSSGGDASGSSSPSMSSGAGGGEGASGLVGAIESFKTATDEALGSGGEEGEGSDGEGSGAIGQFGQLKEAVDDVTTAIGSGDSEGSEGGSGEEDAANLIGAINQLGETTEEILAGGGESDGESGGVIGRFEEFKDVIGEANEHVTGISEGLAAIDGQEVECTIKVNIETTGGLPAFATGTALDGMNLNSSEYNAHYKGNAHVSGTANVSGNWGVRKGGKSLVGELGQEIWVHSSNGTFETVGDNGPEWINTEKGDLIFNHLQSKELLDKGNIVKKGKAYADGTVRYSDGSIVNPDGSTLRPLQPGDHGWDLMQAFQPLVEKMLKGEESIVSNAVFDGQKQMEQMVKNITNSTAITNNTKPTVSIGDINVTCPGVTEQQVAERLGSVIGKELDKQFNGFHNYTDQMSRIR